MSVTAARPALTAPINITLTGVTVIVAASTTQPVVLWKCILTADAATTLKFQDTSGTDLTGSWSLAANGSVTLAFDGMEYIRTPIGKGLQISQTGSANIQGVLSYTRG